MKAAFPQEWNPASDIREAAKKMVKGWDYPIRWIDKRNYAIWIVDRRLKVVHVNQPTGRLLGVSPWKLVGENVSVVVKALRTKFNKAPRKAIRSFERDYVKFLNGRLKGQGFEWKTKITLEREVTNKIYEKEKQIVDYDFQVQREIGARANAGTRSYLTEKEATPPPSGSQLS